MEGDYYKTKESVAEYIRSAQGFSGKELIDKLKEYLPLHSTLLEIGSGPGTDWKILNDSYKVIGSDNSIIFLNLLRLNNPEGEFLELDASSLKADKLFDGIYSNKVLHHLTNIELLDSIQQQYDLLNNDGVICHSFWKGEGSEVFKGLFVNYHTEANLKSVFEDYFEILLLDNYKEFEEEDSILLIGKKK